MCNCFFKTQTFLKCVFFYEIRKKYCEIRKTKKINKNKKKRNNKKKEKEKEK